MTKKSKPPSRSLSKQEELLEEQTRYLVNYRKKQLTKKERIKKFIWDPETKKILGRTPSSWSKIGLFYLIFYGVLAALVAICMAAFFHTLDPRVPKWRLERSIIGTSPGLGFRPMPPNHDDSTLIWFQGANKTSYMAWVERLNQFLEKYYHPSKTDDVQIKTCSHSDEKPPSQREVCEVDVRDWGDCNKNNNFFYHKNSPCVFLKLNNIYGWTPQYYDDANDLPADMPQQLKDHIKSINNTRHRRNVWITCEGEHANDREYLGPIKYYPQSVQGFPGYYYPYLNPVGYLSPLVAVKFERPVPGVVINVECRAWAKNIIYNKMDRLGSVHFELLID